LGSMQVGLGVQQLNLNLSVLSKTSKDKTSFMSSSSDRKSA
jgi:hypothetical protein